MIFSAPFHMESGAEARENPLRLLVVAGDPAAAVRLRELLEGTPTEVEHVAPHAARSRLELGERWDAIVVGDDAREALLATPRKPVEAAFQDVETWFSEFADAVEEIIAVTTGDGRRNLYVSPAFERITGTTRDRVMADPRHFLELVHPDDRSVLYEAYRSREGPWEYDYRIVRPDGETRWLLARGFPVRDEAGGLRRIATITSDITERKLVDQRLERQRRLLQGVTDALSSLLAAPDGPDAIERSLRALGEAADVDRVYIARHRREQESAPLHVALAHEWHAEGLPSLASQDDVHGREPAMPAAAPLLEALERGEVIEARLSELPDPVRSRLAPSRLRSILIVPVFAEGSCWGQVGLVDCRAERRWSPATRSILETTAAALGAVVVRERTMAALAEQVERVSVLHETVANPTLPLDRQLGRALAVGARLLEVDRVVVVRVQLEDELAEIVHVHPSDDAIRPGRELPFFRHLWEQAVREDGPVELPAIAGLRPGVGTLLWVRGRPWGGIAFLGAKRARFRQTDLDLVRLLGRGVGLLIEQLNAERERAELKARFRETQKLESLGLLAGGIAHDFNNLLMAIMGNAAAIRPQLPESGEAREWLAQLVTAAERAADLTRQMLAYAGRASAEPRPVDLASLVKEMSELLVAALPQDVRFERHLDGDIPSIRGDAAQIQQVVMNLITNAAEACAAGGGTVALRLTVERFEGRPPDARFIAEDAPQGKYVVLEVTDTGSGMDADTLARLFEPFFTTKESGRGLGLAAVLGIVRSHRGAVQVSSAPGRGTTFRVMLPAAEEGAPRLPRGSVEVASLEGRVLVVDDSEQVRDAIARVLRQLGLDVMTAADGLEAVERVNGRRGEIDAVLIDVSMPRMGGVAAHAAIRAIAPDLPIVLMSGYAEEGSVAEVVDGDRTRFLGKPFHPDELLRALRGVLGSS